MSLINKFSNNKGSMTLLALFTLLITSSTISFLLVTLAYKIELNNNLNNQKITYLEHQLINYLQDNHPSNDFTFIDNEINVEVDNDGNDKDNVYKITYKYENKVIKAYLIMDKTLNLIKDYYYK